MGWAAVLGLTVGLLALLLLAAMRGGEVAPEISARFSPKEIERAASLSQVRFLVALLGAFLQFFFWGFLFFSGWGGKWAGFFVGPGDEGDFLRLALFFLSLFLFSRLMHFPLRLYGGYYLEKAYGLGVQRFSSWLRDYLLSGGISLILSLGGLLGLYVFISWWPAGWWLPATLAALALTILFSALGPLLYDPLFHRFTPLEDRQLKERLVSLAGRAGITVDEVLVMDASAKTKKVNAYFTGVGQTRRIVLYDNLVNDFSRDEVETVLAHELAHWKKRHLLKGMAGGVLAAAAVFYVAGVQLRSQVGRPPLFLEGAADPAGAVLLLLVFVLSSFLLLPARSYISRRAEREADRLALKLSGKPATQARLMEQLARRNLSDLNPHPFIVWFYYSHPPIGERIRFAERFGGD